MSHEPTFHGVWHIDRPGRPSPFGVQWRETEWDPAAGGGTGAEVERRKTKFFETAEKRDAHAANLRRQRKRGTLHTATRFEIDEWRAFAAATNATPWTEVVAGWRAWQMHTGVKQCDVTVAKAVEDAIAAAELLAAKEVPDLSPDSLRQKRHKLNLFADQFGHLFLHQVEAQEVEAWIDDFDDVRTEATFNNYRKHIRALFSAYRESGMIQSNPIDGVRKRDDSTDAIGILTPEETAHLFQFCAKSDRYRCVIGRFALEAFVGLRFSSGCRLEKKDINFEDRGVLLPKRKLKTRKRHYIDGMPAQVWDWLAITPDDCWDLEPRRYMQLKSSAFIEAGVPHPKNCFRHSFCTYDVAAHKNPGRTAYFLCHEDQDLLWSRYKGNATEAAGKLYQSITPATAAKVAKGYVPLNARVPHQQ